VTDRRAGIGSGHHRFGFMLAPHAERKDGEEKHPPDDDEDSRAESPGHEKSYDNMKLKG